MQEQKEIPHPQTIPPALCHVCGDWGHKTDGSGRWVCYHHAMGLPDTVVVEKGVGRNDPCPCGSGKKSKRCCRAN